VVVAAYSVRLLKEEVPFAKVVYVSRNVTNQDSWFAEIKASVQI